MRANYSAVSPIDALSEMILGAYSFLLASISWLDSKLHGGETYPASTAPTFVCVGQFTENGVTYKRYDCGGPSNNRFVDVALVSGCHDVEHCCGCDNDQFVAVPASGLHEVGHCCDRDDATLSGASAEAVELRTMERSLCK